MPDIVSQPTVAPPLAGKKPTVFIIDDDAFLIDMYALKFREQGFEVTTALNCKDALEKLDTGYRPDVLLVDIVMPGMDGIEFLKTIKEKHITGLDHIMVLSNLGQKEDVDRGVAEGAKDYIVKANFTPSEVVAKVYAIMKVKGER